MIVRVERVFNILLEAARLSSEVSVRIGVLDRFVACDASQEGRGAVGAWRVARHGIFSSVDRSAPSSPLHSLIRGRKTTTTMDDDLAAWRQVSNHYAYFLGW
jgi:hypothetical protein